MHGENDIKLQHSDIFYRSIFDLANDGIILIRGSQFYECNQRALEILGWQRKQLLGFEPWDISISPPIQPDGQNSEKKGRQFLKLGYCGKKQVFEWAHYGGNGSEIIIEVSLSLIRANEDPMLLCCWRDISVRKRTEEALRKSEKMYRRVVEDQTDFIVRWLPDGTRTFINESYCKYFGQSREHALGTNFYPLITQEDRENVRRRIASMTPQNPVSVAEHRVITSSGLERWNRWLDRGLFDSEGKLIELQSVGRDIHDEKILQEALRVSEEKYNKAFKSCPSAIVLSCLEDGRIVEANKGFEAITGYLEEEVAGRTARQLKLWVEPDQITQMLNVLNEKGFIKDFEIKVRIKSGEQRVCLTSAEVITIDGISYMITLAYDVTESMAAQAALEYQASHHSLTNLPNRKFLSQKIEQAIAEPNSEHSGIVLLLMDLNHFKEINDTLGHFVGDLLLKEIGPRLSPLLGHFGGFLAHLGGDEFAILLRDLQKKSQIIEAVKKIFNALDSPFEVSGTNLHIGTSLGISRYPYQGKDSSSLLRCADVAMYNAKTESSGYAFYLPEKDHYSTHRLTLLTDLHKAIGDDQLVLHYQPKINVSRENLTGFEALLRWQHPVHGLIPPGQFIPLAEYSELIHPMTNWVLEKP